MFAYLEEQTFGSCLDFQHMCLALTNGICLLAELYKMVCDQNETDLDINIPAVLLPKDAGTILQGLLSLGKGKSFGLSSPQILYIVL